MSTESITYILGAGASFQSIPIVNSFPKRFDEFASNLGVYSTKTDVIHENKINFRNAMGFARELGKEFHSHHSFDTYFKKLFHTNEFEKINHSKKILNLYFIWEHLEKNNTNSNHESSSFVKQSEVDKRYDALIGGLLKPLRNERKLFCNVNFISWNYDLNLLASIKNYFYPNFTYKEFLENIDKRGFEWRINNEISILNMNGYFYSKVFDSLTNLHDGNIISLLNSKLTSNYFEKENEDKDSQLIRFAWENSNDDFKSLVEISTKYILDSKNIVVIGYTFPLYNRLIDLKYLNPSSLFAKSLIIQDPKANEILPDFLLNFSIPGGKNTNLIPKSQCESFFVPEGIFKY